MNAGFIFDAELFVLIDISYQPLGANILIDIVKESGKVLVVPGEGVFCQVAFAIYYSCDCSSYLIDSRLVYQLVYTKPQIIASCPLDIYSRH